MLIRLIVGVCCAFAFSIFPSNVPQEPIHYEVAAHLNSPGASQATWSPDGSQLAVTAWPTIQIWDTVTWKLQQSISDAHVYDVKWRPSGDRLAGVGGGDAENLYIWNPQTGELLKKMSRPRPPDWRSNLIVRTLAWSPEGNRIISDGKSFDANLLLWDLEPGSAPQTWVAWYEGMPYDDWIDVAELSWSHNGKWLLGAGGDGNIPGQRSIIRLWDAASTETVRTIFPGFHPLWSKDDRQFAGLSEQNGNRVINIWDTETGEILSTLNVGGTGMNTLSWNTDANVFAGGRVEEPVAIWNMNSGQRYDLEALDTPFVENVEWRPHRNQLAIADQYEGVFILDFDFGG